MYLTHHPKPTRIVKYHTSCYTLCLSVGLSFLLGSPRSARNLVHGHPWTSGRYIAVAPGGGCRWASAWLALRAMNGLTAFGHNLCKWRVINMAKNRWTHTVFQTPFELPRGTVLPTPPHSMPLPPLQPFLPSHASLHFSCNPSLLWYGRRAGYGWSSWCADDNAGLADDVIVLDAILTGLHQHAIVVVNYSDMYIK